VTAGSDAHSALNTGPRSVGRPTEYKTSREYVGRAYPCSRAVTRPAPAEANTGEAMARVTIILICLALANCGPIQRAQYRSAMKEATAIASAAVKECRERRLSGEFKTYVQSSQCANERIVQAYRDAGYPYMDLIAVTTAARVVASENIDHGRVSEAEAQLQLAELFTRIANEERRRDLETADAHQRAGMAIANSTATLLQGLSALQATSRPGGITCTTFGNATNCR
jgi:hypothetical protein